MSSKGQIQKKPLIVLFVGVPGSGKTTFARQLAKELNAVLLSSDSTRIAMWGSRKAIDASHADPDERRAANQLTFGALNYATEQTIVAGHSVIYDCNANSRAERQEKYDIAARHGAQCLVVRIRVPYDVAFERIQTRGEAHDSRQHFGDKAREVLDRFDKEIEEPTNDERAIEISGEDSFNIQYAAFREFVLRGRSGR